MNFEGDYGANGTIDINTMLVYDDDGNILSYVYDSEGDGYPDQMRLDV